MSVRSSEGYHAMKTNNMHSTPDQASKQAVRSAIGAKMAMVDELQAFFVERTKLLAEPLPPKLV